MSDKDKVAILALVLVGVILAALLFIFGSDITVLNPKGTIAAKERHLIILSTLLMLIVVVPVFVMTFGFAWRYREGNRSAKYSPDWDHHPVMELLWWAIPSVIIIVLALVAWRSSHDLDPFKKLNSGAKPLTIQVVALQWKWLFIYPEQNVASVNFVQFPVTEPVDFEITADAPMNSFWIPQLGGQIYAMPGMSTELHLMADEVGDYRGSSANISGAGFSAMKFVARASNQSDFNQWLQNLKSTPKALNLPEYDKLAQPNEANSPIYYSTAQRDLFAYVVSKFMPTAAHNHNHGAF